MSPTSKKAVEEMETVVSSSTALQVAVVAITFGQLAPNPGITPLQRFWEVIVHTFAEGAKDVHGTATGDWDVNAEAATRLPDATRRRLSDIAAHTEFALDREPRTEQSWSFGGRCSGAWIAARR